MHWQVDELLEWTTSLNYEDYVTSWKQVGTSSQSETAADKRHFLTSNVKDRHDRTIIDGNPSPRATTNTVQDYRNIPEMERIPT